MITHWHRVMMTFCVVSAVALEGCSSTTPNATQSINHGNRAVIEDCVNVRQNSRPKEFTTRFYHTTLFSAVRAGAAQGLYEGLQDNWRGGSDPLTKILIFSRLPRSRKFCRSYHASLESTWESVHRTLHELGYRWAFTSKGQGLLETEFVYREKPPLTIALPFECVGCKAPQSLTRWRDRFFLTVSERNPGEVVVRIHRDVGISRRTRGAWSDYLRETSNGHNEKAILHRIEQELASGSVPDRGTF